MCLPFAALDLSLSRATKSFLFFRCLFRTKRFKMTKMHAKHDSTWAHTEHRARVHPFIWSSTQFVCFFYVIFVAFISSSSGFSERAENARKRQTRWHRSKRKTAYKSSVCGERISFASNMWTRVGNCLISYIAAAAAALLLSFCVKVFMVRNTCRNGQKQDMEIHPKIVANCEVSWDGERDMCKVFHFARQINTVNLTDGNKAVRQMTYAPMRKVRNCPISFQANGQTPLHRETIISRLHSPPAQTNKAFEGSRQMFNLHLSIASITE